MLLDQYTNSISTHKMVSQHQMQALASIARLSIMVIGGLHEKTTYTINNINDII